MSQQQREQALLARRVAAVVGLMVAKGEVCSEPASVITLARAATQKEALNTRSYNEGKKLVCKFCRQYAVNNSAQKGGRRWPADGRSAAPAASNLFWGQCAEIPTAATRDPSFRRHGRNFWEGTFRSLFSFPHKKGQHLDRDEICQTPAGSC